VKLGDSEGWVWPASKSYLIYENTERRLFDIADPFHPHMLNIPQEIDAPVGICGKYVFVDSSTVIDLSDPSNAHKADAAPGLVADDFYSFACDDVKNLYFTWREGKVEIYSLENLVIPVASLEFPNYEFWGMQFADSMLYVNLGDNAVIIDVETPSKPQALAAMPFLSDAPAAFKGYLYLNMHQQGIGIFKLVPN
jgi:hypothetical protein